MSASIDTNILIYAANKNSPHHAACLQFLSRAGNDEQIILVWPVIYEFLRLVTHPKLFERPLTFSQAWRFLISIKDATNATIVSESDEHDQILNEVVAAAKLITGNLYHDAHIATILKENGITRLFTNDRDFHLFSFLTVLNPITEAL